MPFTPIVTNTEPPVSVSSDPVTIAPIPKIKHKSRKIVCSIILAFLVVLIIASFGAFAGVAGRDWLRGEDWYKCLRNGFKCPSDSSSSMSTDKHPIQLKQNDTGSVGQADVSKLYENVSPAVVTVVLIDPNNGGGINQPTGIASGFIIDDVNGLIITNDHAVCSTGTYKVITKDNTVYDVQEIQRDSADDLALMKVNLSNSKKLPSKLSFADSDQVKPGQFVVAIGNPEGNFPTSVTTGVISGVGRSLSAGGDCNGVQSSHDYYSVFQTDAAINPGNSGGPLLNMNGDVIGVNSATSLQASNISFSIPGNRAVRKINEYLKFNKFQNPYVGIKYQEITTEISLSQNVPVGAYISQVITGSPADKAGIKKGDVITKFANKDVNFSLQSLISAQNVGDNITVVLKRKNDAGDYVDVNVKVILGELPANSK